MRILNVGLMIGNPENGFQKAMKRVATNGYAELHCGGKSFKQDVVELAKQFKPRLIFIQTQQEGILDEYTAYELSKIGFTVNFSGDVREKLPDWYINVGKYLHLSTFTNMVDVKRCREKGLRSDYLEIGVDPTIFKKRDVPKSKHKLVAHFNDYGNLFPLSQYRRDIVKRLKSEFGDSFGIYGNFPNKDGDFNNNQELESMNYNAAKIAVNTSHFDYERYASDRMLRITGSGCMCLSHHYTDIEKDWVVGKEVATFKNLDELVEKCRYYLEHEDERKSIADAGHKKAHQKFTFDNMCQNLVKLYWKHLKIYQKNG